MYQETNCLSLTDRPERTKPEQSSDDRKRSEKAKENRETQKRLHPSARPYQSVIGILFSVYF